METTKICTKCKTAKEISQFNKNKSKKDGLSTECKSCIKIYKDEYRKNNAEKISIGRKKHYEENKEKILEKSAEWKNNNREHHNKASREYHKKNREKNLKRNKEYYLKNKEFLSECSKKWALKNRIKTKEYKEQYYKKNKESIRKRSKEYRKTEQGKLSKRNSNYKRRTLTRSGDATTIQLRELVERSKKCYWCDSKIDKRNYHIDHIMPLSKGGLHTITNLVVTCPTCNLRKNAKDPFEFANQIGRLL